MLLNQTTLLGPQAAEPLPPAVIKAIARELKELQEKPEEGIKVCLVKDFVSVMHHIALARSQDALYAVVFERRQHSRCPGRV